MDFILTILKAIGIIQIWKWLKRFTGFSNKQLAIFVTLFALFIVSLVLLKKKHEELNACEFDRRELESEVASKNTEVENLKSENKRLRDQAQTLGYDNKNEITSLSQNVEDFLRDWDHSESFYNRNDNEFCPRLKGQNNYQRIPFKRETSLAGSKMRIKLKMVDEVEGSDYKQRVVVGLQDKDGIVSEFDIPTRDGQTVNFRERNLEEIFDSFQDGKSLSSPIKEGGVINLIFETSQIETNRVAEKITVNYLSSIEEYGSENEIIGYSILASDSQPKNSPVNFFVGSYVGGCIQTLDWEVY